MSTRTPPLAFTNDLFLALSSSTSINAYTLDDFKRLLGANPCISKANDIEGLENVQKSVLSKKAVQPVALKLKSKSTTSKSVAVKIHETPQLIQQTLQPREKRNLATEAFNSALKVLTDTVRAKNSVGLETTKLASAGKAKSGPLQPSSPNKQRKEDKTKRTKSAYPPDIRSVSDCAIFALDCLRELGPQDRNKLSEHERTLARGALILVEKLVSLEQTQSGLQETVKLYDQFWKRRKSGNEKSIQSSSNCVRNLELCSILLCDATSLSDTDLGFISSYQSQVLRLAIALGPKVVTHELVNCLKPSTLGSPAEVVLRGLSVGYLNEQKAGDQLRTIAQALLKLYSISILQDKSSKLTAKLNLFLLVEALSIKVQAWKLIGHSPDLEAEFWKHLMKGITRFEAQAETTNDESHAVVLKVMQQASAVLHDNTFKEDIPVDVINAVIEIAEKCGSYNQAFHMLQVYQKPLTSRNRTFSITHTWRLATIQSKERDIKDEQLFQTLETAAASFKIDDLRIECVDNILLHGARLRKAVYVLLQDTASLFPSDVADSIEVKIARCTLEIILGLSRMFAHIFSDSGPEMSKEQRKVAFTSFAKVFEIVIETCNGRFQKMPILSQVIDSSSSQCTDIANSLVCDEAAIFEHPEICAFIKGLLVKLSQSCWKRYLEQINCHTTNQRTIHLLKCSSHALSKLPLTMQRSASYSMKIEKLALAYWASKEVMSAFQAMEESINHYIDLGGLNVAVEAALSGSNPLVWSKRGTVTYSLGKALLSLAKLRLRHGLETNLGKDWIFDRDDLPALHRCVLFEAQLSATQDHDLSIAQSSGFAQNIHSVMQLCSDRKLQVYRLRLFGCLLRITSKNSSFSDVLLMELRKQSELLLTGMPTTSKETCLSSYAVSMYHTVSVQWLMHQGDANIGQLRDHVRLISEAVLAISSIAGLEASIDDIGFLLKQLRAVFGFGRNLDNFDLMLPCLLTVKHILLIDTSNDSSSLVQTLTDLAVLYNRLNKTTQAGKAFAQAEELFINIPEQSMTRTECLLSYAEYLLNLSNTAKAIEAFEQASTLFQTKLLSSPDSGRQRLERNALLSRAGFVASRIASQLQNPDIAIRFGRQAAKLSTYIWQSIETTQYHSEASSSPAGDTSLSGLVNEMSSLTVSSDMGQRENKLKGSAFWCLTDLHFQVLHRMADLSIHAGLFQDAQYYADQQRKLAQAMGSDVRLERSKALLAYVHAKAGLENDFVVESDSSNSHITPSSSFEDQQTILYRAEALLEMGILTEAKTLLSGLIDTPAQIGASSEDQKEQDKGIKAPPVRGRVKVARPIKMPAKRSTAQASKMTEESQKATPLTGMTVAQQYILQRSQAIRSEVDLQLGKYSENSVLNTERQSGIFGSTNLGVANAKVMLRQALNELSSDAVKCVLAETAVALPVRYRSARKSGRVSFAQALAPPSTTTLVRSGRNKNPSSKAEAAVSKFSVGEQLIIDAQKMLQNYQNKQAIYSPSETVHTAYKLSCRIGLLSSTIGAPVALSSSELVLQSLTPKDMVQGRERAAIKAERSTRDQAHLLEWPELTFTTQHTSHDAIYDCSLDDLSEIPETWSILTISLSDDQQELMLSKIAGRRSPFLMRVPLSRSDMEINDVDEFCFAEAKAELIDIVQNANISAHDHRGQGDYKTRKAWYAERESLDKRLETWLSNIESLWLGGFRGLMSSLTYDDELLARFGQKLNLILDKHLPSRQRSGSAKSNKIALHAHVLELFLGLGHPDEHDLDDAAIDLLYFVVDILQFSGEHNAYDEIDFDAILVDVFDAMKGVHGSTIRKASPPQHTILVVDKEMAAFPWESLPCLKKQSVSRMPSLGSIIQRVRKMHEQSATAKAHSISTSRGAYMLNPSSDLVSTQALFEPILQQQLPNFTSTINVKPTEPEFSSILSDNELFMYFGHGSGAQYIRGRTIRNLDTCAVTLLMGCSSAKMTECGKFESYGMPGYYMGGMSNCMAVVGTLWDVTDRDIDRFALKTLIHWGLLEETDDITTLLDKASKKKGPSNQRGKGKEKESRDIRTICRGQVTLDQAVCKGREACLLRYLNGAAPVVYGVPVVLQ